MSAQCLFIEPSDVWLFRDARPFSAGETSRAAGIFPPTPQTMQGMVRSLRLGQSQETFDYRRWSSALQGQIGQPNDYGALTLRGPLLASRTPHGLTRYFPLPQDITKINGSWRILTPAAHSAARMNWPAPDSASTPALQPLLPPSGTPEKFETGWLDEMELAAYLSGVATTNLTPASSLFEREPRFGIEMDNYAKCPVEGRLYQAKFMRLREGIGLLLEVGATVPLNPGGLIAVGGEARAGRYVIETAAAFDAPGLAQQAQNFAASAGTLRFKLYLATPALFGQGWLPKWIDANTLQGETANVTLTLRAAALGRPQNIGGRSIATGGGARLMYRAVPAGSVYFFETNNTVADVVQAFHGRNISDLNPQIGFGLAYMGGW